MTRFNSIPLFELFCFLSFNSLAQDQINTNLQYSELIYYAYQISLSLNDISYPRLTDRNKDILRNLFVTGNGTNLLQGTRDL